MWWNDVDTDTVFASHSSLKAKIPHFACYFFQFVSYKCTRLLDCILHQLPGQTKNEK